MKYLFEAAFPEDFYSDQVNRLFLILLLAILSFSLTFSPYRQCVGAGTKSLYYFLKALPAKVVLPGKVSLVSTFLICHKLTA